MVVSAQKCGHKVSISLIVVASRFPPSLPNNRVSQHRLRLLSPLALYQPLLCRLDRLSLESQHFQHLPNHSHTRNSSNKLPYLLLRKPKLRRHRLRLL